MFPDVDEQLEVIKRGVVEIFPEEELIEKLKKSRRENSPLRVKLGIDPTSPHVHLGNSVPMRKLRQFQEIGHKAVLIIGDYTTLVGDPSERDKTRPMLSHEDVMKNASNYIEQIGKVVDVNSAEIVYNGEWFSKMTFQDVLRLTARSTVARMLERDDFAKRFAEQIPISLHELIYPLMQGYDSVMVRADIELGATEQKFNLLAGRDLQRDENMEPQVCVTLPILVGPDGQRRMGKSLGNAIGIDEPPSEIYGKLMSIPDDLMRSYFELLTDVPLSRVEELLSNGTHPKDAKVELAKSIVTIYHGAEAAQRAAEEFEQIFAQHQLPDEIPIVKFYNDDLPNGKLRIAKLIVNCGFAKSNSEAKRLVTQGGVCIDNEKVSDPNLDIKMKTGMILKVGKRRFAKIEIL